jgi:O-antigen/teichoic acid export membrane protein
LLRKNNILKFFEFNFDRQILKSLLSLGLVYALSMVVLSLNYRIDTIMLDRLSSSYEVGIYSKGSVMIQYLWQIPMLLGTIVFARSARAKDSREFSLKVCQLMRLSLTIIGIGCVVLSLLSGFIINLLFGASFAESASAMALLAPGVLLLTIFKVLFMDMSGRGSPMLGIKAMLPALVINVIANYFLIPLYGADGASISSTISYSFGALYFLHIYSRFTGISIKLFVAFHGKISMFLKVYLIILGKKYRHENYRQFQP